MEAAVEKKETEQEEQQLPHARKDDAPAAAEEYEADSKETERRNCDLKAGLHPRRHKLVLWYTRRTPGARSQAYEDNIKKIIDFSTVESFWVCYYHLARPSSLPSPTDLHLFKDGICPLWEDPANQNGGKWIIRFKKAVSGRFWEDLVSELVLSIILPFFVMNHSLIGKLSYGMSW
ncbi:unnamed protein product [Miscanthus lutarioriparius]|uniref:mRNA cap-binding protein n=1 Tax=Miscanthus lutarioriparius TaxID=422564 RepID=A0A811QP33_9POAL|nr:unnamed protein product [Miscanthus lutarioriparius]